MSHWTITNRTHVEELFRTLMEGIGGGDTEAVILAVRSTDGGATYRSLTPNVKWSQDQANALTQVLLAGIPALAARVALGDLTAYRALELAQTCTLLSPWREEIFNILTSVQQGSDSAFMQVIRSLLAQAMNGDLPSLRAAADLCRMEEYSQADGSLEAVLPPGLSLRGLAALVEQYNFAAIESGAQPFMTPPF